MKRRVVVLLSALVLTALWGRLTAAGSTVTTTTVTSSVNPSVFGQSVTFTAVVTAASGSPTGTVAFTANDQPITGGTAVPLIGGMATFSVSTLLASQYTIVANYSGDVNYEGSSDNLSSQQVVDKSDTTTTVTSSMNPSVDGQSVTLTATVSPVAPGSGTPSGSVTFLDGGSSIGTGTLSGGVATFSSTALSTGNHTITATYGGDTDFSVSTGSLTGNPEVVDVNTTTTVSSSVNPCVFGQLVTFTATVSPVAPGSGTPTGTVTFLDGGSSIGTGSLSGGVATFATSALTVGNHTITANYGGGGNFNGSTGSLTGNPQVVSKSDTTTTVISSQNPSAFGQSVTFTANVSPVAPGAGTPTGTVTFMDGGSPIATETLSAGMATFSASGLTPGSHTITASYGGDTNFNVGTASLTGGPQVVQSAVANVVLTISPSSATYGTSVTLTATVSPSDGGRTPTGTVTFRDGTTVLTSNVTLSNGKATFSLLPSGGNHSYFAVYSGDATFGPATGSASLAVQAAPDTVTLSSPQNPVSGNQPVTLTAVVAFAGTAPNGQTAPGGTVTFLDGTTQLGTAQLNATGTATLSTSFATVGAHSLIATYAGDNNYQKGASPALTQTVLNPFIIAVSSTTQTLTAGGATFNVSVTSSSGFSGAIKFTCTGLPAGLAFSFNPPTLPANANPVASILTVFQTPSSLLPTTYTRPTWPAGPFMPVAMLVAALMASYLKRHAPAAARVACVFAVMVMIGAVSLTGCGGSSSGSGGGGQANAGPSGVAPGTYPFTMSVTSGSFSASQQLFVIKTISK